MPALIGVSEFVEETTADYKSPITSSFVSRMQNMKQTIATLEEVTRKNQFFFHLSIIHHHPLYSLLLKESVIKIQLIDSRNINYFDSPTMPA